MKIKSFKSLLISSIITLAVILVPRVSYAQIAPQQDVIEVTASAKMNVVPNKIEIQIQLSQNPSKGKIEISTLEKQVSNAINTLGLDVDSCLKVVNQSSNYNRKTNVFQFKTLIATVSSAEQAAELFALLSEAGIGDARIVNITHTDIEALQLKIKARAMVNARTTAETVAAAVSQSIGNATYINVNNYNAGYYPVMLSRANKAMLSSSADNATEDSNPEFQEIEIEQTVSAKFKLLP